MSVSQRVHGVKILKAVSSPLRLQILSHLFDEGPLSYTELMNSIKMSPSRDAGRFAYHLKFLLKSDLVEADVEAKKYCLSDLGKMVIDVADRIEKRAFKSRELLVRTSRFALEEFDANRITNSLIKEAKVPAELAQKVAKEAEKELLKSKTKYITAPLVREVVNAILVEKGLEEYRNKLTRLGLPVQEVAALIESKDDKPHSAFEVQKTAGKSVLDEYVLLNVFPRDVADAHLSGSLHVEGLDSWILEPNEVMHDLRFFLQNGLNMEKVDTTYASIPPPYDLQSALLTASSTLMHSAKESHSMQTFDYFNIFLAPFMKDQQTPEAKERLRQFITSIAQFADITLGIELTVPNFLAEKTAIGPHGKSVGKLGEFAAEAQLLASLIIELLTEEAATKPFFNPRLVVKVRTESFEDPRAKAVLLKAHGLAANTSLPFFANLLGKRNFQSSFSGSGFLVRPDRTRDWEIDTMRTGCLGSITVNLPRVVYECEHDKTKFMSLLKERIELAARAIEIKYQALKRNGRSLLPFLTQNVNGDHYFRLENSSATVNLAGFREATEVFTEKSLDSLKTEELANELGQEVSAFVTKIGRRHGRRISTTILPSKVASERLARLDVERYGLARVRFSGARENPFYSTSERLAFNNAKVSSNSLVENQGFSRLNVDGLDLIDLGSSEHDPSELLALTEKLVREGVVSLFAYDRSFTYCANCKKSWFGKLQKCPSCGAVGSLTLFDRFGSV